VERVSTKRTISLIKRGLRNYFTKRPFCISFEVTHSCNARCKHCHLGGPVEEERASPERLGEICRQLSPLVAQASGGEPLLRRDLEEIIDAFKVRDSAPYIIITTNGTLLTKKRYKSLHNAGVDEFSISLDYPDERHDEFRGVPGLFQKIENIVREIKEEKSDNVTLCCVIQSGNFRELMKIAELASDWKVKLNFSAYTTLRTQDEEFMLSKSDLVEFKEIAEQLLEFKKSFGCINTSEYAFKKFIEFFEEGCIPNCQTGYRFFNVNPDGTISPCGLIKTDYNTREEFIEGFSKRNTCESCFTSIRANCERPLMYLLKDSLEMKKSRLEPVSLTRTKDFS